MKDMILYQYFGCDFVRKVGEFAGQRFRSVCELRQWYRIWQNQILILRQECISSNEYPNVSFVVLRSERDGANAVFYFSVEGRYTDCTKEHSTFILAVQFHVAPKA